MLAVRVIRGVVLGCAALLAACGGGESSGPPQSPTGVWGFGTDAPPDQMLAIINSAGRAIFISQNNGEMFSGIAEVSGTDITIEVDGYPNLGSTFSDGSRHGTGAVTGTVTTGGTLSVSLNFTTDSGTAITADWTLLYYSFYESSSLATVTDTNGWIGGPGPVGIVAIDPSGAMSSLSALDGCVLSGSISTADPAHNVYDVSYTFAGCSGEWEGLNGVQFTGLAFDSTNDVPGKLAPPQLMMSATGASATTKYGFWSTLLSQL